MHIGSLGTENAWYEIPGGLTVDNGAAKSVIPRDICPNYPSLASRQQREGVYYVTASGEEMENEGEKRLKMNFNDGKQMAHTFQVTDVNKALGSASRLCEAGNRVIFNPLGHPDGNYLQNLATGSRTPMLSKMGHIS